MSVRISLYPLRLSSSTGAATLWEIDGQRVMLETREFRSHNWMYIRQKTVRIGSSEHAQFVSAIEAAV